MKKGAIVWAVTPVAEGRAEAEESALKTVDALFGDKTTLQPIYVWDRSAADLAKSLGFTEARSKPIFSKWKKPGSGEHLLNLRVLEARGGVGEQARTLVDFAREGKAALIVASHRTRLGLKRWFQGSFCETLSLISDIPLLIVPPHWKVARGSNSILFPTDFSKASMLAFSEILKQARQSKLGITVYHRAEYPVFVGEDFLYSASREMLMIEREVMKANLAQLQAMKKRARSLGVSVRTVFDKRRGGRPAEAILTHAKKGYAMIAMAAHNGLLGRMFIGSTTRKVLRECPCPLWIVHTRTAEKMAKSREKVTRKKTISHRSEVLL